jgi:hypothetical protein
MKVLFLGPAASPVLELLKSGEDAQSSRRYPENYVSVDNSHHSRARLTLGQASL